MIQTWILRSDVEPQVASKAGLDGSVCGACPHRHSLGGSCYVITHQGPLAVYRSFKRGNYPTFDPGIHGSLFTGRMIRLGAYGDPAAVPVDVWSSVVSLTTGHTGYTHQIGHPKFDSRILHYCMVSADTPKGALAHQFHGRRTFRVKTEDSPLAANEVLCLSETTGISCLACGLCNGAKGDGPSVAINVHGTYAKRYVSKYGRINAIAV
ncbi:hypothetical protein [Marinobacter similis]|nr:hypothetical protein [Marinobacter similis]